MVVTMIEIEPLLSSVTRPGRYTGGEWNSITKRGVILTTELFLLIPMCMT